MNDRLRALAGQSLILSFAGTELTAGVADLLARTRAAGVVLFSANVRNPAQLARLCADLQACAAELGLPPLLIAIDQEGGVVSRLPPPFVVPPSPQALAASGDARLAYAGAHLTGAQLRAHGVNVNFAPVLDVNCNPANPVIGTRAFGADAATVTRFGLEALRGYRDAGVIAVGKHFPGHGDTTVDSHHGLPVVDHSPERLAAVELAPFRAAIAAGIPAIMSAHVLFPALDNAPATLSPAALRGLLRDELSFKGLVFTDALDMRAIAGHYGAGESAVLAKRAGADIMMPLGDAANQIGVAEALAAALAAGRLDEADFEATLSRLARLRAEYRLREKRGAGAEPEPKADGPLYPIHPATQVDFERLAGEGRDLARRSITVRDAAGLLPLARETALVVIDCLQPRFNNAEDATDRSVWLRGLLLDTFPKARYLALFPDAPAGEWASAAEAARAGATTLLITRNAWALARQRELAAALLAAPAPLVHLAARGPQDADLIPGAAATLLTYGDPPLSLAVAVERLAGAGRV